MPSSILATAIDRSEHNLRAVLSLALEHPADGRSLVIWDGRSDLSLALTEAYRRCLPAATFL